MLPRCSMRLFIFVGFVFGVFREIESTIRLVDNGYEGVVVIIKDTVNNKHSVKLVDRIKEEFTDASRLMFKATKHRAYFRNITIVVPRKWTKLNKYMKIPAVNVFSEHIRVDRKNKLKGRKPYVRGNMECGKPGWYMHLTPTFFLEWNNTTPFGNHENAIIHEWGHLRWGLFDEYASIAHPNATKPNQKINFYTEDGSWKPVTCSKNITGRALRGNCNVRRPCKLNSIQINETCRFCPYKQQPGVQSSLMATQWLKTMDSFCDEDADTTETSVRHNSKAPNLQNTVCDGQSAWEVMLQHEDFKNGNNPNATITNTTPSFLVAQEIGRIRMLVFDVSGSMRVGNRIAKQKQAAWWAIDNMIEKGSRLGIVSFSSSSNLLANLTRIRNNATRHQLKKVVPQQATGGTEIYEGLILAVRVLERGKYSTKGTEIILLSDGVSNSEYLHIIPDLKQKGIIVHTIAVTNAADQGMTQLAQETGGRSFTYLETEAVSFADVLGQVIATGSTDNEAVEKVLSKPYSVSYISGATGTFTIDQGLGNFTEMTVLLTTVDRLSINVTGPNNETYYAADTTDMLTLHIPDVAEVGRYHFEIATTSDDIIPVTASVTSQPVSEDDDVLRVTSRMSNTTLDFQSSEEMKVYASIEKGGIPVLNANVTATLAADTGFTPVVIVMLDSGTGADVIAMDGVYSAYLLNKYFTRNSSRYNIKINIVGDGNAFTYTTDVNMGGSSVPIPGEEEEIEFKEEQLDEFQRQSLPGEITVVNYISNPSDSTPPAQITDLRVDNIRNNAEFLGEQSITYTLSWTAVGDDMDIGNATSYDMRMDTDNINLRKNFNSSQLVPFNFTTPKPARQQERIELTLTLDDCNGTCFIALRAIDAADHFNKISNIINVDVNFFYEPEEKFESEEAFIHTAESSVSTETSQTFVDEISTPADAEMIIGIVIGTLGAAAICASAIAYICIKRKRHQITKKSYGFNEIESGQPASCKILLDEYVSAKESKTNEEMPVCAEIPLA